MKLTELLKEIQNKDKKNIINEHSDLLYFLIGLSFIGINLARKYGVESVILGLGDAIKDAAYSLKNLIKPDKLTRFSKMIDNDNAFSSEVVRFITDKGGIKKIKNWKQFSDEITNLRSFKNIYEKFCKQNNIDGKDKEELLSKIKDEMSYTMQERGQDVVDYIKSKHPEIKDKLNEIINDKAKTITKRS